MPTVTAFDALVTEATPEGVNVSAIDPVPGREVGTGDRHR
jgi:hypothetical protein